MPEPDSPPQRLVAAAGHAHQSQAADPIATGALAACPSIGPSPSVIQRARPGLAKAHHFGSSRLWAPSFSLAAQPTALAPADGLVKNIFITTVGGVIRQSETMLELVPTASDLIVEAKVSTKDIAYVKLGQSAKVNLDAYDSSIFGAMNGEVSYISPDTLQEDTAQGKQPYYRTLVLIKDAEFKSQNTENIQIRPGMTASVSIKARERSVFSYLTKPVTKTINQALGER